MKKCSTDMKSLIEFIRDIYGTKDFVPLHAPCFKGNEKKYVEHTIDSTFVSSVGEYVNLFEQQIENYVQTPKAIATVNGTAALHMSLHLANVKTNDLVITQALTFVATCNAIAQVGAEPIFIDVCNKSLGLCPNALEEYLETNATLNSQGICQHKASKQIIKAALPMHTFGHPVDIEKIQFICQKWNLILIEDSAESLGSLYKNKHTGTFGDFGILSFNGNKVITTGGGGMILCKNENTAKRAKHVTTTAKVPHDYESYHDELAYNYRLPNINAALGCAQMENLNEILIKKRELAKKYQHFFRDSELKFVTEPQHAKSNYWLNAIICPDNYTFKYLLETTNKQGVMTRPIWTLMHHLPMYKNAKRGKLTTSEWLSTRLINIPSTPVWST